VIRPNLPYRKELRVLGPAEHLGYRHIVAHLADGGATREAIVAACAEAADDNAPKDALCKRDGRWMLRSEVTRRVRERLDSYTRALVHYEDQVRQAQKTLR
jgi:hypothetical protein